MRRNAKRIVKASRTARTALATRKTSRMSALKASKNIRGRRRSVMASMSQDELEDEIKSLIEDMDDNDVVYLWNEYCREINDDISEIYPMDDFDEMCEGMSPTDIAQRIFYGEGFNPNDDYFGYTGYANFVSFNSLTDDRARFYIDDLVDYIVRNEDALGNDEIQEILDSANDDDEDEE